MIYKILNNRYSIISILIQTPISGSTMTGEGLAKIGQFIPRLEKVYLDDIFTDSNHLIDRYLFELDNVMFDSERTML